MTQDEQKILSGIVERFQNKAAGDEKLLRLREKQDNGTLTWEDVKAFSEEIGILSSEALQEAAGEITAIGQGNGYDAVIEALRANSYAYVTEYAEALVKLQNEQAGIGMNASQPVFNENKASGIASKAAHGETEEETRRALGTPVKTFTESVVNDTIEANARNQSTAGLEPKVIRTGGHKCCDWCEAHTGKWVYGDQPSDFFRQHANCTCMIEFSSQKIRYRVNGVHNKGYGVSQKGWGTTVTGKELEKKIEAQTNAEKLKGKKLEERQKNKNVLTVEERYAINKYMSFDSYVLNEKLRREEELSEIEKEWVRNLDSALDKMPNYSGNLYRTLYFEDEKEKKRFLDSIIGGELISDAYMSTSKNEGYNPDGNVFIFIENAKSGKDISAFNHKEQEVLYKRGQKLKIFQSYEIGGVSILYATEA